LFELTPATACSYLQETRGLDPAAVSITELGGGVSNTVLLIEHANNRFVLKQSLGKLRVEQDWFSDRGRIHRECEAIRYLNPLLPPGRIPGILFEDRENCIFGMTAAEGPAEPWKTILMRGECNPETARTVGDTLASTIRLTWKSAEIDRRFGDTTVFKELRLDPYYRSTAAHHPDLQNFFETLIDSSRARPCSMVHGDYSPKNFLVEGANVLLIDFEVVHYGDPSFDAAFLLNHLLLKSFHMPEHRQSLAVLADSFWSTLQAGLPAEAHWFESSTVAHLAGLLLARMDGKSPAEYIRQEDLKRRIRKFARELIASPPATVHEVVHERFR
jgi:5-methylthioribose kinase